MQCVLYLGTIRRHLVTLAHWCEVLKDHVPAEVHDDPALHSLAGRLTNDLVAFGAKLSADQAGHMLKLGLATLVKDALPSCR